MDAHWTHFCLVQCLLISFQISNQTTNKYPQHIFSGRKVNFLWVPVKHRIGFVLLEGLCCSCKAALNSSWERYRFTAVWKEQRSKKKKKFLFANIIVWETWKFAEVHVILQDYDTFFCFFQVQQKICQTITDCDLLCGNSDYSAVH